MPVKESLWQHHIKTTVDFIYRVVAGARYIRITFTPIFAGFFLFLFCLTVFLALKADAVFNLSGPVRSPWNYFISLPLLAMGVFLWLWLVLHFMKANGTPVPVSPHPKLVNAVPTLIQETR